MISKPKSIFPFLFPIALMLGLSLFLVSLKSVANEENVDDAPASAYVEFPDANLKKGRELWIENCEGCHAYGIADSPIPMEPEAWKDRIAKGKPVLYKHAIEGFFGEDYAMMPARGGNPKLSDDEVKAAVDYMVALASVYIEKSK